VYNGLRQYINFLILSCHHIYSFISDLYAVHLHLDVIHLISNTTILIAICFIFTSILYMNFFFAVLSLLLVCSHCFVF
jgi:hypothetical protein